MISISVISIQSYANCTDLFIANNTFRMELLNYYQSRQSLLSQNINKSALEFIISTLVSNFGTNKISPKTIYGLRDIFDKNQDPKATLPMLNQDPKAALPILNQDPKAALPVLNQDTNKAILILNNDPYFKWLSQKGLDPVGVFISGVEKNKFSYQLAIVNVFHTLDPSLTDELKTKAATYLNRYQLHMNNNNIISEVLEPHFGMLAWEKAWSLAPSYKDGLSNYLKLISEVSYKYKKLFSKSSYERALLLPNSRIQIIKDINKQVTIFTEQDWLERESQLLALRADLKLPEFWRAKDVYALMVTFINSKNDNLSYELFLTRLFEDLNNQRIISYLRYIIELSENRDDSTKFSDTINPFSI